MSLLDWPEGDRPREKLAQRGPASLSDTELLAILIRTGSRGSSALDLARPLAAFGLAEVSTLTFEELAGRSGVGPSRAAAILAAFELGRRAVRPPAERLNLSTPEAIFRYFGPQLNHLRKERFIAMALNAKNRLLREEIISEGDLSSSIVHPREVFAPLIRHASAAVIFVHNHPSGDPNPSQRDLEITHRLKQVGDLLGIKVLDHVIVSTGGFYSFHNHGFFEIQHMVNDR